MQIVEVAPRDGLQNEATMFSTDEKIALITAAVDAGVRRIEVASFVNPKRVPQMADGEAVVAGLPNRPDVSYIGLVLNRRGFERAAAAGVDEVNVVVVATETFSQRNQGMSTDEAIGVAADVAKAAHDAGIAVGATISAAFGCPYEGEVPVDRVVDVFRRVADTGVDEIALADTIGAAVPTDVEQRLAAVREVGSGVALRAHFHNTRNTGLANAATAALAGVSALDASLGGIGGCPFAPGATGNIPTEDLVYLLDRMGVETGVSLSGLVEAIPWLEERLGQRVPGLLSRAGPFPRAS